MLQKWLDGTITWQEERELEQLAKGDAMLADALVGFQSMPESNHTQQITQLKKRLQERTQRKQRGLIFYLPRVAAVAALVATLAFGIRYFVDNAGVQSKVAVTEQEATSREQQETINPAAPTPSIAIISEDSNQAMAFEDRKALANQNNARAILKPKISPIEAVQVAPESDTTSLLAEAETAIETKEEKPVVLADKKADAPPVPQTFDRAQSPATARAFAAPTAARVISGKVTDTNGAPLIGASVTVKGTNQGTVSDIDGSFKIELPPGKEQLAINYTGFTTQEINVAKNDSINIQLNESSTALSEVVVSGYAKNRKEDSESIKKVEDLQVKVRGIQTQSAPQPQPSVGLEKFKRYIKKNLRYPKAAREAGIEGEVAIAFQILPNGELTEFKILKSLGYGCDEEAIRLLKQGPKWERSDPIRGKENMAYLVEFKLKK